MGLCEPVSTLVVSVWGCGVPHTPKPQNPNLNPQTPNLNPPAQAPPLTLAAVNAKSRCAWPLVMLNTQCAAVRTS